MLRSTFVALSLTIISGSALSAQEGYEYEVYSTHIAPPRSTILELHSNFVPSGTREIHEGVIPSNHALRSSFEVSHGLNRLVEGSFYFVGGVFPGQGSEYVGSRLRVTAIAPAEWKLPVELGVSQEVGYARPGFSEHRWMYELSPIVGKSFGAVDVVVNPALERGFGHGGEQELELEPRGKLAYHFGDEAAVAIEYYGSLGPATAFEPAYEQHHQLFATFETELGRWEIGGGVGRGLTRESDRTVLTTKLEYHL